MKNPTCKHRVAAVALAAGGTLALVGGTAFAGSSSNSSNNNKNDGKHQENNKGKEHNKGGNAQQKSSSYASGFAAIDQNSKVFNLSASASNTGLNDAFNGVDQSNSTDQNCNTNTEGGDVSGHGGVQADSHKKDDGKDGKFDNKGGSSTLTGNTGGDCSNDSSSDNSSDPQAWISTGSADASNWTGTNVTQHNSGGVDVSSDNNASIDGSNLRNAQQKSTSAADGALFVSQGSKVGNVSIALANSGGNSAANEVSQANDTSQNGNANTEGGNVSGSRGDVTTGNSGGSASNSSQSSNSSNPSAKISTGDASASNKTSTTVDQVNNGGVSVQSSNNASIG